MFIRRPGYGFRANRRGIAHVVAGGGGAANPYGYGGALKMWWDATDLSVGTLTTVLDKSGNGNDGTGVASPTVDASWPGSLKRMVFNGTTQYVNANGLAAVPSGTYKPFSMVFAAQLLTVDANYRVLWGFGRAASATPFLEWYKSNAGNVSVTSKRDDASTLKSPGAGALTAGVHVFSYVSNGLVASTWEDGVVVGASQDIDVGATTLDTFSFACRRLAGTPSLFAHLALAEVVAYNESLSATNRLAEEARLKAKWGTP